jgi:N-acyl-D-amino-acid deacylase
MLDLILENARVLDGTGKEAFTADVGLSGERIEGIGNMKDAEAARRVDISGKTVCPGFIDVHSHADMAFYRKDHPQLLAPLVEQGITTFVGGNCGMALSPITREHNNEQMLYLEMLALTDVSKEVHWDTMDSFMDVMDSEGILLNCALLAPHGVIRLSACGLENRLANREEIKYMRRVVEKCMQAGAFGLSTGLQYPPGNQSDTEELMELGKSVARYGGIFTSHLRSYTANTLGKAMEEVAEVVRKNDIRGQISHIFSMPWFGPVHRPVLNGLKWLTRHQGIARAVPDFAIEMDMKMVLSRLEKMRAEGAQLGMDIMPTTAGFAPFIAYFPPWALTGDRETIMGRFKDKATRAEMRSDIEHGKPTWPHRGKNDWSLNLIQLMGWDGITIMAVSSEKNKHLEGRCFTDLAEEQGKHPFDLMCDLLVEEEGHVMTYTSLAEPDDAFTERYTFPAIRDPLTMISTDTILMGVGKPCYLVTGCYPKFIGRYVNEKGLVDLPDAVRRCTSIPAEWFGIKDRGEVKEGYFADLLVMRPGEFKTDANFLQPERCPEGLDMVLINGKVVVEDGRCRTEPRAGKMLRK